MTATPRWNLPLLLAGQAQKEISHNEALLAIDRVLHLAVGTRTLGHPPDDAIPGDNVIVGPTASGDWRNCSDMVASYDGIGWTLTPPRVGCLAWICDEAILVVFHDNRWQTLGALVATA